MLMNQLRAILLERGLVFPQGRRKFETAVGILVTDPQAQIGARIQALVAEIREEWASLDGRIEALDREFVAHARADEAARRLVSIPGVGPMTATALRAAVDDGSAFASARDLPAWLGLVPRQHTTGGKPKLLGISKRGNAYLRGLFIHGARAALASLSKVEDATGPMVARSAGAGALQRRGRCARRQARADRLGDAAQRSELRAAAGAGPSHRASKEVDLRRSAIARRGSTRSAGGQ